MQCIVNIFISMVESKYSKKKSSSTYLVSELWCGVICVIKFNVAVHAVLSYEFHMIKLTFSPQVSFLDTNHMSWYVL